MGINNRYDIVVPHGKFKGSHTFQTQSVSGNFTGSQTDPSSYRGPAEGEFWELLSVRVYQKGTVAADLDIAIILTDEDGIEYARLSMDSNSPTTIPDAGVLTWNAGAGTVLVLPTWRLYAKWYGAPVPAGAWNWQYTAAIHDVAPEGPFLSDPSYIP